MFSVGNKMFWRMLLSRKLPCYFRNCSTPDEYGERIRKMVTIFIWLFKSYDCRHRSYMNAEHTKVHAKCVLTKVKSKKQKK